MVCSEPVCGALGGKWGLFVYPWGAQTSKEGPYKGPPLTSPPSAVLRPSQGKQSGGGWPDGWVAMLTLSVTFSLTRGH